jgi:hypothetical protein
MIALPTVVAATGATSATVTEPTELKPCDSTTAADSIRDVR